MISAFSPALEVACLLRFQRYEHFEERLVFAPVV